MNDLKSISHRFMDYYPSVWQSIDPAPVFIEFTDVDRRVVETTLLLIKRLDMDR